MPEFSNLAERFANKFLHRNTKEEIRPVFDRELFQNPEVEIDENPLPLTRVAEIGLYNDLLNLIDRGYGAAFKFLEKFGVEKSAEWQKRSMTDEKAIAYSTWESDTAAVSRIMRPDVARVRHRQELGKMENKLNQADTEMDKVAVAARAVQAMEAIDNTSDQYIRNQRTMKIRYPQLGEIWTRFVEIKALKNVNRATGESTAEDPKVIYLGGWANDPRGEFPMLELLAEYGLDVVGLGYVDGQTGIATPKLVEQIKGSPGLEALAELLKAQVRAIKAREPGRKIQGWGQSTGALIWATALSDPEFSKEIDGCVIIGGASTMDVPTQAGEFIREGKTLWERRQDAPLYSQVWWIGDRTGLPTDKKTIKEIDEMRRTIWGEVTSRTNKRSNYYDTMQVASGSEIVVDAGAQDTTTLIAQRKFRDDIAVIIDPEGKHQDTNTRPERVVRMVLEKQKELRDKKQKTSVTL